MKLYITKIGSDNQKQYLFGNKTFTLDKALAREFTTAEQVWAHIASWGVALADSDNKISVDIEF